HDDEVDGLPPGQVDQPAEDRPLLLEAGHPLEDFARVPVGGVEQLHDRPSNGSTPLVAGARSSGRVAQAGNGNSTTSGTGISGWETNIVPGLAIVARSRWTDGRKPYSGRPASAASSRPTTRIEALAIRRRSTSLAVCWATSRRISLIGDCPSRGAYLFSSSSTRNSSGRGTPDASLASNVRLTVTPTTNRLARSGRLWRST